MTEPTPRTEAGRFLWDEYNPDHEYELSPHVRTLILAIEAEAAAQARTEALREAAERVQKHRPVVFVHGTGDCIARGAVLAILAGETER